MLKNPSQKEQPRERWLWRRGLMLAAPVLLLVYWRAHAVPIPVPVDAVMVSDGWADESACAQCHEQAESFWDTGHAQTLRRASDPESLQLLKQLNVSSAPAAEQTRIEIHDDAVLAITQDGELAKKIPLEWCFGSGEHAVTWTSTMTGTMGGTDLLEFRWTWYHERNDFALTPGHPSEPKEGFHGKLGMFFDGPKARRCFSCHAGHVPGDNGTIEQGHILTGVACQRCHGPRKKHVATEGAVRHEHWRGTDRMDAVNRCARCHRRAEEQEPEAIRPDNLEIVRFQPVGLVQSACFVNSEMTCTTCHDPHKPLREQDSKGIWQCVQCHDPQQPSHVTCGAGELDRCVQCHMPALQMDDPLKFTDHWIRVRETAELDP